MEAKKEGGRFFSCPAPTEDLLLLWLSSGLTPRARGRNINGRLRKRWAVSGEWALLAVR